MSEPVFASYTSKAVVASFTIIDTVEADFRICVMIASLRTSLNASFFIAKFVSRGIRAADTSWTGRTFFALQTIIRTCSAERGVISFV